MYDIIDSPTTPNGIDWPKAIRRGSSLVDVLPPPPPWMHIHSASNPPRNGGNDINGADDDRDEDDDEDAPPPAPWMHVHSGIPPAHMATTTTGQTTPARTRRTSAAGNAQRTDATYDSAPTSADVTITTAVYDSAPIGVGSTTTWANDGDYDDPDDIPDLPQEGVEFDMEPHHLGIRSRSDFGIYNVAYVTHPAKDTHGTTTYSSLHKEGHDNGAGTSTSTMPSVNGGLKPPPPPPPLPPSSTACKIARQSNV